MQAMTKEHPKWEEFVNRLEGPEGCDFKERVPGKPLTETWTCLGGTDKSLAQAILKTMSEIDIAASMEYFESRGGRQVR